MSLGEVIGRIGALPPMPGVAVQLLKAAQQPNVDLAHVARWIEHDPAMTASLLRVCNSPLYYGMRSQVLSVRQAVGVLGLKHVVGVALTFLSSRYLGAAQPGYGLAAGSLWRNSVGAAIACELLAEKAKYANPSAAYTAGLLQDIGKIVLSDLVAACGAELWSLAEVESVGFDGAEAQVLGASHAEAGALLLERWGFPVEFVESVRFHHEPSKAVLDPQLARLSHLADVLTMSAGIGVGGDGLAYRLDREAAEGLQLHDPGEFEALMRAFVARFEKADTLLRTARD